MKDADHLLNTMDEITFAKPLSRANSSNSSRVSGVSGVQLRGNHIPEWLPDFSEESTYMKEGLEGKVEGMKVELALWERSATDREGDGKGVGETTGEGSGGELRSKRGRMKEEKQPSWRRREEQCSKM
ncbi:unnamed protein product [Linum trigynum]|uniref:Uncharacterized protein n=1 Tax=Linum trigynum TaxID=586398 RepID=A0AAV2FWL1_9ROSI